MKHSAPPSWAVRFFRWYCREELQDAVLGDLTELYHRRLEKSGKRIADALFIWNILLFLKPFALKRKSKLSHLNYFSMFQNYFKIGIRSIQRQKVYSFINIGGLALGLAVAILIGLWVYDELSFDKYHSNYHRIAQVMQHQSFNGEIDTQEVIPFPLGEELDNKHQSEFKYIVMTSGLDNHILSFEDKSLTSKGNFMDVDAPHLLSLNMLRGERNGLKKPGSILLSESLAKAVFGNLDPIGKLLKLDNKLNVLVTGIYEDLPFNTTFNELMFIAPWSLYVSSNAWIKSERDNPHWNNNSYQLFVQIAEQAEMQAVSEKIKDVKYNNLKDDHKILQSVIFLHPMKDWHLRSSWKNGMNSGGVILYVWLFGLIGIFVMILACINFMNLSTAYSEKRSKEVCIRKSVGSSRGQLISQFLSESLLVAFLAFIVAIIMVITILPSFNQLADKQITFPFSSFNFWLVGLSFTFITAFLAGSYPAFYLSSFQPVKGLKGSIRSSKSAISLRKSLVVLQFTVAVILIIGTLVVEKQIQHTKNRPIGYDRNGIIMVAKNTGDYENKYNILRNELKSKNAIIEMTESSSPLTGVWNGQDGFNWEGKNPEFNTDFAFIWVSHDFGNTVGWEVIEGRDFSREFSTDSSAFIINEAAIEYMGLENPIGQIIRWGNSEHEIIGVVKNMLMESPFRSVKQSIYTVGYEVNSNWIVLKLNPDKNISEAISLVEEVFTDVAPAVPFEFKFVDQEFEQKFKLEERIGKLSGIFALLAIIISCLGLFGLSSFLAERRTKELGVRKVLGASVFNLWQLLSKELMGMVLLSCIGAVPIAYYAMISWLKNYEYQTEVSWWVFIIAGICALTVTLFTVSYHSIKASLINPVKSLKAE